MPERSLPVKAKLFLVCLLLPLLAACPRQNTAVSASLSALAAYHSGALAIASATRAHPRLFVDAPSQPQLAADLAAALGSNGFQVVKSPSDAGYILHVAIIRTGHVGLNVLRKAVNSGYGAKASFSGQGCHAILADALLVTRRPPEARNVSHQRIKNISERNATGSAQMRLAIAGPARPGLQPKEYIKALATELAARIRY